MMEIKTASFVTSLAQYREEPPVTLPQLAVVGKSNVGKSSLTIEATGDDAKLRGLEDLLRAYGIKETVRTGKVALSRSSRD